jgi:hypothetical protein
VSEPKKTPAHHDFEAVVQWLRQLRSRGFYGTIQLGFQSGEISYMKNEHPLKPGDPLE